MKARQIDKIIIHHTAGPDTQTVADIRREHVSGRGFSDIGYHCLIDRQGGIHPGRPEDKVGAHCLGCNANSLGLAVIGYYHPPKNMHLNAAQKSAIVVKLAYWCIKYGISTSRIYPHSAAPGGKTATACPGDWIRACLPNIISATEARIQKEKELKNDG